MFKCIECLDTDNFQTLIVFLKFLSSDSVTFCLFINYLYTKREVCKLELFMIFFLLFAGRSLLFQNDYEYGKKTFRKS